MVKKNVFVLWGEDKNRDIKIKNIRRSLENGQFLNIVSFDSLENNEESLLSELYNFSFSPRLFIISNAHQLKKDTKDSLKKYIDRQHKENYFIFVFPSGIEKDNLIKDSFYRWLFRISPPLNFSMANRVSTIKDFFLALRKGVVSELFLSLQRAFINSGERREILSLKVLGATARHFTTYPNSKEKNRVFRLIFHADRTLKHAQLNPQYVLELLLLRIFGGRKFFS